MTAFGLDANADLRALRSDLAHPPLGRLRLTRP